MCVHKTLVLSVVFVVSASALGQVPLWHGTLDDLASITNTGGEIRDGVATFVPGAIGNAFAGNSSVYARWDDDDVENLFGAWNDDAGVTVDLYFRGDHWSTHSDNSGFWSIVRRSSDRYIILSVLDGNPRLLVRDAGGEFKWHLNGNAGDNNGPLVTLANDTTYRMTISQHAGVFEMYLDGGAFTNDAPTFSTATDLLGGNDTLPFGWTWDMVPGGGNPARQMNVGRRAIFDGLLQTGEWVDEVRVYNGFYSPAELDAGGGLPLAVINADVTRGPAPLTVHFDGTASRDADGTDIITLYEWDFDNDGTVDVSGDVAAAGLVSHEYAAPGTYVCKLTVTDDENETASSTVAIEVHGPPSPGVLTVTDMLPAGGPHTDSQILTSITTTGPYTVTDLVGPTGAEIDGGNGNQNGGLCDLGAEYAMLGLELGRMISGGDAGGRFYFPVALNGDGTGRPDIFVLEHAGTQDNFNVELLTSGPGELAAIAATIPIRDVDYGETATQMTSFVGGLGGVGIDLDALTPSVSDITGVQLVGGTGLDPCLVAGVPPAGLTIAPIAVLTASPTAGGAPLPVAFDGACGSYDPDGDLTYAWDFTSDGSIDATGPAASHTYVSSGTFTATLTVTDDDGLTGTDTVVIEVEGDNSKRTIIDLESDDQDTLVSITTEFPGGAPTFIATDLVGPPDTNDGGDPPDYLYIELDGFEDDEADLVGLDLSGTGVSPGGGAFLRAFFPDEVVISADGTDAPEIFVIEKTSATTDDFMFQLLTSGPGEPTVIVATVHIFASEYANVGGDRGGVGLDLDVLGVGGIRGVQIPGYDGLGGETGIDPSVIAGVPARCNVPFADANGDGDVDQGDFALLQVCLTGSGIPLGIFDAGSCLCFDRDDDQDVDEQDFNAFRACATGPEVLWTQELTPDCTPGP